MGWCYSNSLYYGILIDSVKTGKKVVNSLCKRYDCDWIEWNGKDIIIFVYKKVIAYEHGSYAFRTPKTTAKPFEEPIHPIFRKKDDSKTPPKLTERKQRCLRAIERCCAVKEPACYYHIAKIS